MTTPSETALSAEWATLRDSLSKAYVAADIDAALRYSRPRIEAAARSPEHSCANHDESLDDAYRKGLADAARSQPATEGLEGGALERAVVERLGFDPTNHHNAAKCPYCLDAR